MNKQLTSGKIYTQDKIKIGYNLYQSGFESILIVAHGWFMSKDSKAFNKICEHFNNYYDVISFDFRGHCSSSGFYSFGANETADLKTIIDFIKDKYKKIYLIGFSLGSLISINYCAHYDNINKLILVSAPTDFKKIENNILSPNAFIPTLKKFELKRWLSIRFSHPFKKKPIPIKLIDKIKIPILFIAGDKDPIIKPWHNEQLYNKAKTLKKEIIIKNGKHAEDLYLEYKDLFINECINWLKEA